MDHHYEEDARLKTNQRGNNSGDKKNVNATISSEQANAGITRAANNNNNNNNVSSQVEANTNTNSNANANANANANVNPPKAVGGRHLCSHCSTPGHRYPECPHRPCKHCNVMGHVGKDCPEIVQDRVERRRAAWRRYHAHIVNGANRK